MNVKKLIVLSFLAFTSLYAFGQRGWELGGWLGTSHYFGDLNTSFDLSTPGLSGGVVARYNFNDRICFKLSGNYGSVRADDANSENSYEVARNLSFQSPIIDGSGSLEFNFLPYLHGSKDQFYTPYLFAGFTGFYFNPMAERDNGELVELRSLGTEGQFKGEEYYSIQGGLNYGVGFKVALNYEWSLNFEIGARSLFTDYLDDVSTTYTDLDDLADLRGPIAAELSDRSIPVPGVDIGLLSQPGRQRGNSSNNDTYVMAGVSLVYYFGDLRCPEYSK